MIEAITQTGSRVAKTETSTIEEGEIGLLDRAALRR